VGGSCITHEGEDKDRTRILVGKPGRKRPLGRPKP
jgi:hypothetical protein